MINKDLQLAKIKLQSIKGEEKLLKLRQKENSRLGSIAKTNLKQVQKVLIPQPQIISKEQEMLGQLFGHGDKFFGSKKMLPFAGTPDEEGSETWRSFGI